ncbi:MAG: glycerate kinase [Solirubrobacteraceae bacterium]
MLPDRDPRPILVAPDKFKGTFTAAEVAAAVAAGLEAGGRAAEALPVADGGDGTAAALLAALGGEAVAVAATDALGREAEAAIALLADGRTAVVEVASASGLHRIAPDERDAEAATSAGTGELLAAAVAAGATRILVAAGGSATTDGGAGAIAALQAAGGPGAAELVVLSDVRTPFERAAAVFGPQKGADGDAVARLGRRLAAQARRLPRDPRGIPMTGAAGGLAGGLWAAFGATLAPGAPFVLDALGFDARMRAAHAVITGEGRLDESSLEGKALAEVATRCRQAGVPCHAVVGQDGLDAFGHRLLDLQHVLEAQTLRRARAAGAKLAERI